MFVARLLVSLVHLRHGATHNVPAYWFEVDRSTITRAIGEVRPCLPSGVHHEPRRAAAGPGRCRPPGPRSPDRRTRGDTTAP
ncbi:transposase family protein [Streptomyces sp. NPDC006435]|uniref:helix-turn-helix domain-containing protein n=1 Tax=Streptomyces sp. NPDC006435 TaxID=3154300 RepID=UPI00339DF98B